MIDFLRQLDSDLLLLANEHHTAWLDSAMIFITSKNSWIPVYMFLAIAIVKRDGWRALVFMGIAAALAVLMADQLSATLVKPLVGRMRPCQDPLMMAALHLPKGCSSGFSFVSSHAANFGALAMLFSGYGRSKSRFWIIIPWFCALIVSYTRVYLGVHYPSDVLGGMLLGAICGGISYWGYAQVIRRFHS